MQVEVVEHASTPPSPWEGYKACLHDLPSQATHVLVVQDDAIACRNLPPAVEAIARSHPETPVSLFLPGSLREMILPALHHEVRGLPYIPISHRHFIPAVAVLWPRTATVEFLHWADGAKRLPGYPGPTRSDDAVLGVWAKSQKREFLATCPSLIEHPDDVVSTIGKKHFNGKSKARCAISFIGERDPLDIDW